MPYAVIEKAIERLDETQQNTDVLFVRFLPSQKAAASAGCDGARPRRYDFSRAVSGTAAGCDWFLTTDRGILKHISSLDGMRVANPVDFAMEDES